MSVVNGPAYTRVATIRVGNSPADIAADQQTNTIYAVNSGSGTVSVISGRSNTVTGTVPVGKTPIGIAVDSQTRSLYVANLGSNTVSVLTSCG